MKVELWEVLMVEMKENGMENPRADMMVILLVDK